jgi:hypothetical protein
MRRARAALAAIVALTAWTSASAFKNPASIALDERSREGVLLVSVPTAPFGYKLTLQKEGSGGFGSRVFYVAIGSDYGSIESKYETRRLAPGRYVLKYVMQQNAWIGCLEDGTVLIDVKAGRVNYLGHVDARETLKGIQAGAVAAGELTGGGGRGGGIYYDLPKPTIDRRDAAGLDAARAFVRSEMPRVRAPVELATIAPYSFRRPDDRNRRKKDCS